MLKKVINRICVKENVAPLRRDRATAFLGILEEKDSIVLDREGLTGIGMSRRQAFQTLYDLVVTGRAQMRAEEDGTVVVMTNDEYIRRKEQRARETWAREANLDIAGGLEDDAEEMCGAGQRMPERRRERWISFEDVFIEQE